MLGSNEKKLSDRFPREFENSLRLPETIINGIGISIFNNGRKKDLWSTIKSDWLMYASVMALVHAFFAEIGYVVDAFGSFDSFLEITETVPCLGYDILGFSKLYTIRANKVTIERLMTSLGDMWPVDDRIDDTQKGIKIRYVHALNNVTKFITILYTVLIWLFNLYPLVVMFIQYSASKEVKRMLPYYMWYGFDVYQSLYYQMAYAYQMWGAVIATIGIVGPDLLLIVSISHICMMFEMLEHEILNIVPEQLSISDDRTPEADELYEKLNHIIKQHQMVNSFAGTLENIYSPVILVNFCGSSIIICLVGFQATAIEKSELIKFIIFLFASLVQVAMICYYGNLLTETSSGIASAAYNCRWYQVDVKFRRALSFLILRAQKPMRVTALQFSIVTLRSFTSICSKSWSYFTLLRTIYIPK